MIARVYSTVKDEKVQKAIKYAEEYLSGLNIQFTDIAFIKKKPFYEVVLSWALSILRPTKSIATEFIESLGNEGCGCVILFVDKARTKEDGNLYGQHTRKNGISYIEVYVSSKYYVPLESAEGYTNNKVGYIRTQVEQTLIHELFHAYSDELKTTDILHAYIAENSFELYKDYLLFNQNKKPDTNSERLYKRAKSLLGTDVTPKDEVPDQVACMACVNAVYRLEFGVDIGGGASTNLAYKALLVHPDFTKLAAWETPRRGDIGISPTGYQGQGGQLTNGHVCIVSDEGKLMSNNSYNGLFEENYTMDTWRKRYVEKGKYPFVFFRRK